jgi:uncharacterized protein (DUF1330 family)
MKMRTLFPTAVSILAGIVVGAGAVQCLYARAKPPAYVVTEADVTNLDAYIKDYLPLVRKAFATGGGKYLVRNGRAVSVDGDRPKRIAILEFENLDRAQAALTSSAFKDARAVGQEHATFRTFAIEGVAY